HGRTVFDLGIGQTVFFADRRVAAHAGDNDYLLFDGTETAAEYRIKQQINTQIERDYYRRYSDVALQANWYLDSVHALRADLVWDPYDSKTRSAAIALHYRDEQARIANLAWRMKRQPGAIASDGSYVDMTVNQLDGSFYLPLNASWHTFLRANVDIEREELIESIVGLRYESCCWAVMTAFKRERKTFENNSRIPDTAAFDYQQSWYIQFELTGLGGVTNTIRRLLEESIQGFE
ncbi:MAG TPA: LPS assembly protein LptD, partial [Pseudomonadales bacterium]